MIRAPTSWSRKARIPQKVIRMRLPQQGKCLPFKVRLLQTWSASKIQMYVILRVRIPQTLNQTLNQTLKWRSSVSPRQCLYALVVPLVLDMFPIAETVPATPEM